MISKYLAPRRSTPIDTDSLRERTTRLAAKVDAMVAEPRVDAIVLLGLVAR